MQIILGRRTVVPPRQLSRVFFQIIFGASTAKVQGIFLVRVEAYTADKNMVKMKNPVMEPITIVTLRSCSYDSMNPALGTSRGSRDSSTARSGLLYLFIDGKEESISSSDPRRAVKKGETHKYGKYRRRRVFGPGD